MSHSYQNNIGYWIKLIFRETGRLYDQRLAQYGITTSQVGVLVQLWNVGDGLTQKELHERLRIRPASLTNLLDPLVKGGWVIRKQDAEDARVKRIFLTDAGRSLEQVCGGIVEDIEERIQQQLTPEESALMLVWLRKIHNGVMEGGEDRGKDLHSLFIENDSE
ncbi:hypothetical protein BCV73_04445 [Paenibacillus sp. SSG-1]|uniref:MarR family winged helix-turn-helix transcriptional regulator n=1 Tax=Paenibacillus TaxID=44249 RepID=UPI000B7D07B8|nr:MarR family transcriptional regulator [Paenibacillus sp. SSG-1]OXL82413.1 hypothetical protein BCV73_04445 [Paenibacillus sp. SSG-1]